MLEDDATTPEETQEVAPETLEQEPAEVEAEAPTEEDVEGEQDSPEEDPAPEMITVDIDGVSYEVPKALEGQILMQRDYTKKTQAHAEAVREFEQSKKQFEEAVRTRSEHLDDAAALRSIDTELARYQNIDWDTARQQDPEQAQWAFQRYTLLRNERGDVVSRLQQRESEFNRQAQQEHAKRLDEARTYAAREIPNWSTDLESKLEGFSRKHGIDTDLVRQAAVANPASLKILHLAYLGEQFLEKQRAASKKPPVAVKPVKKVSGGGTVPSGPRDEQSTDDWLKARNRQLAKQR